ncbi:MAG: hypothetical protein ABI995_15810 [Acidobacteriota bacterium]
MDLRNRGSALLFLAFAAFAMSKGAALCGAQPIASAIPHPLPSIDHILTKMAQARLENRTHLRPYNVTRQYQLLGKESEPAKALVLAKLDFAPPDSKRFAIQEATGTRLGEKIVRQMLEHETGIVKDFGATDLSPANYEFRFVREEQLAGENCYVLSMLPLRREKTLLSGHIWIDAKTFQLRRQEGEPAKSPSWWFRSSGIVLNYGSVHGMWLQVSSESSADVRLVGKFKMVSHDLEYKMSEPVASNTRSQ